MFVKVWIKEILDKEQEEKKDARDCIYAPRHPFVYLSEFSFQTDFFLPGLPLLRMFCSGILRILLIL